MARGAPYLTFLAVQTLGAAILLRYSVPLYRQVLADPSGHEPHAERLIWSLLSIALMQGGYWLRERFDPPLPRLRNALLGHVISFIGRMSFVLATATFSFVFLLPNPELQVPPSRYIVLIVGLFALFCYMQELKRLGTALGVAEASSDNP